MNWTMAIVAGIAGLFVGGPLVSLPPATASTFRPSGIIGSIIGPSSRRPGGTSAAPTPTSREPGPEGEPGLGTLRVGFATGATPDKWVRPGASGTPATPELVPPPRPSRRPGSARAPWT